MKLVTINSARDAAIAYELTSSLPPDLAKQVAPYIKPAFERGHAIWQRANVEILGENITDQLKNMNETTVFSAQKIVPNP